MLVNIKHKKNMYTIRIFPMGVMKNTNFGKKKLKETMDKVLKEIRKIIYE